MSTSKPKTAQRNLTAARFSPMADHDGFPFPFAPTRSRPTRSQQEHGQPCKVGFSAFPQSLSPPAGLELFAPTIPPSDAIDGQLLPSVLSPPALETMIAFPTSEGPFQPLAAIVDALQDAENTFNRTFAEAIPCPIDLPTPPHDKPRRLRLPSFQVLGIASPHPDALSPGIRKIPLEPIPGFTGTTLDAAADAEIEGGLDPRHTVFGDCVGHAGRPRVPMALPGETITPPEESSMTGYSSGQPNPGARIGPEAMAEQIEASTGTGGSGGTLVTRNPSRQGDQSIDDATAMDDQALRGIINKIRMDEDPISRLVWLIR